MGDLIVLAERRADRSRARRDAHPVFFFDLASPLCYLTGERVERLLPEAEWVPVLGTEIDHLYEATVRAEAELRARAWRLPLVWPDIFPAAVPMAMRAADYAREMGAGCRFAVAASRLAFCGGFDLDDPEILAEAAAVADLPLDEMLRAAADPSRERTLRATAAGLRRRRVRALPAIRVGHTMHTGEDPVAAALAQLRAPLVGGPVAPFG